MFSVLRFEFSQCRFPRVVENILLRLDDLQTGLNTVESWFAIVENSFEPLAILIEDF